MTKRAKPPRTSKEPGTWPKTHGNTQATLAAPDDERDCRYCSQRIKKNAKVCHNCGCDQRRWVQRLGNTVLIASILISAFMLVTSYCQLMASERELAASEKKELAATQALEQAQKALLVAQKTGDELDNARRKLVDLAKVTGTAMLTDLMAGNFGGGTTLKVRLSLCDRIIGSLREIGLSEDEIARAKEMYSKGIGVIYHWAIGCALEGRTDPDKINMNASPELRRASMNSRKW